MILIQISKTIKTLEWIKIDEYKIELRKNVPTYM
jgi:hypothetical protein